MSYEQAVVDLQTTNATLVLAVNRVRDAAMGMNRMYSSTSAGVAVVQDGEYFVVPGGGVYQRLYQRSGGSATLIAEYPDASEVVVQSEIGTAAALDVTTSSTDTTAGRLMKVGDYGIGIGQGFATKDADALTTPGIYSLNSSSTNIPISAFGQIRVSAASSGGYNTRVVQEWFTHSDSRRWVRSFGGSSFSAWLPLYNGGNILGTVSQSGGVPTGAIIERGSNANGGYTKFADGTLICLIHNFEPDWGSAAYQNVPLPHSSLNGNVTGAVTSFATGSGGSVASIDVVADALIDVTSNGSCRLVFRGVTAPDLVGATVNMCFYGRWY